MDRRYTARLSPFRNNPWAQCMCVYVHEYMYSFSVSQLCADPFLHCLLQRTRSTQAARSYVLAPNFSSPSLLLHSSPSSFANSFAASPMGSSALVCSAVLSQQSVALWGGLFPPCSLLHHLTRPLQRRSQALEHGDVGRQHPIFGKVRSAGLCQTKTSSRFRQ
jgi:hypothetical protein